MSETNHGFSAVLWTSPRVWSWLLTGIFTHIIHCRGMTGISSWCLNPCQQQELPSIYRCHYPISAFCARDINKIQTKNSRMILTDLLGFSRSWISLTSPLIGICSGSSAKSESSRRVNVWPCRPCPADVIGIAENQRNKSELQNHI